MADFIFVDTEKCKECHLCEGDIPNCIEYLLEEIKSLRKQLGIKTDIKYNPIKELELFKERLLSHEEYKKSAYLHGLTNGLILANSILTSEYPEFEKKPVYYYDEILKYADGEIQ
jgi:hypothetical protein